MVGAHKKERRTKEKKEIKEKLKEAGEKPLITESVKKELGLIEVSGLESLDNLDPLNLAKFERICANYSEKIKRMLDNVTKIKVHVKATHKGGKQRKYEIDVKAISATKTFSGSATDWDIERTTHKCFNDIEKQIIHRFRNDTSYKKPYA